MNPAPTSLPPGAALILDRAAIERCLKRIAHEIIERNPDLAKVALIGIPSRGIEIAKRLTAYLKEFSGTGTEPFTGVVDVAMHRDDLHRHRVPPRVERTILPRDLEEMTIVLTDDVLFSGRTCRAAMDSISSFGRPARIQYAVLVDRGHRELPIRADYVGKNLPTALGQRVHVRFEVTDGIEDSVWMSQT
jgi:pyrimidine operon attenuation protein/uracil phosphoribosyltransferase